jgi:hypothetical protein
MRKAAMLVLFALLAVAMVFAQTPANANSNPTNSTQTQSGTTTTNPDQNATGAATGQNTQSTTTTTTTTDQNNTQVQPGTNQTTVPNNPQTAAPSNTQTASPSGVNQTNTDNSGLGVRPSSPTSGDIAAGTEIRATLDTPLSTKTSKPGDRFTATISQPVQGNNGVAIPVGSRIEGEVAESEQGKALPQLRGKGKLNLRFRDVVLPNGQSAPLVGTLVSVNSTNGKDTKKADNEGQIESGTRGKDVAKDVGIGAGVGTVAGLIFGGPLKGLAIGAIAGGGYVLATKGKDVNLPAETGLVLRLDQPLSVH